MIIEKKPTDTEKYRVPWTYFESARAGLKAILELPQNKDKKILLPAYIGWSEKEGSGVFDPIKAIGNEYEFYHLNENLEIILDDFHNKGIKNQGQILFLIHYFGLKDPSFKEIKEWAKLYNLTVVEDFAHGIFTFYNKPIADFDYAIFSFHKMFPVEKGGAVLGLPSSTDKQYIILQDTKEIIQKRQENYVFLRDALLSKVQLLRPALNLRDVYQSFPILLKNRKARDAMYYKLNNVGYGVVTLYYALIDEINRDEYPVEHEISDRILNLPCHQDCEIDDLGRMVRLLLNNI